MSNGKVLRYTDPRRFGAWLWTARIGIAQDFTVTHNQINVIVFFRRQLFAQDAQAPGYGPKSWKATRCWRIWGRNR
jgi:hypothetical protein